jgi:hypothetical protein
MFKIERQPPFSQLEVAAVQHQEEKKEEEKNADLSSAPVIRRELLRKGRKKWMKMKKFFGALKKKWRHIGP